MIHTSRCPSPLGDLIVEADATGLTAVRWADASSASGEREIDDRQTDHEPGPVSAILDGAITQLGEYFAGVRREFDLPLAPVGTSFQLAAWEVLCRIPFGHIWTYRDQAAALGDPAKARAVGSANGRNPLPIIIPCHRVCATGGGLGGYTGGTHLKAWLLRHEADVLAGSSVLAPSTRLQ